MSVIKILESKVYNQISAGEVIENPASIVKELAENSIDAGAKNITISILDGGIKYIGVVDDGIGMDKEDLKLSVKPHATSKLKNERDLDTISTLGFRGEALASIAAVSELEIKSKYIENDIAYGLIVKGNEILFDDETILTKGTAISVNSLFYNTPARYKFLKSPVGEESNIKNVIIDLALANPDIAIKYIANSKTILQTLGDGLEKTLFAVFGGDIANNLIPINAENKGYKINGFIAVPTTNAIKNNKKNQIFIVNGRVINDLTISAVIQNAYGNELMKRTFPTIVLDIIAPFDMVDVNVHPNKREVRFAERKVLDGLIYHGVSATLEEHYKEKSSELFRTFASDFSSTEKIDVITNENNKSKNFIPTITYEPRKEENYLTHQGLNLKIDDFSFAEIPIDSEHVNSSEIILEDSCKDNTSNNIRYNNNIPPYKIIGQVFSTYLVLETDDKLLLIDQHAAHERILYNALINRKENATEIQDLFLPIEYKLNNSDDEEYFNKNLKYLEDLGFFAQIRNEYLVISAIPACLLNMDVESFLNDIIFEKNNVIKADKTIIKDIFASKACKNAIKGGKCLTDSEIKCVVEYFFDNGLPLQCPHGRPTLSIVTKTDFEKLFKRLV